MLLEAMLQMEPWLKLPKIRAFEILHFEVEVCKLIALEKVIGKRSKGMGFCTFNFHAAAHLSDDMLCFGVPHYANSSSNEMHHKPDKTAALCTQRIPKKFDMQLAKQVHQMEVVNQGLQELTVGVQKWSHLVKEPEAIAESPQKMDGTPARVAKKDIKNAGT